MCLEAGDADGVRDIIDALFAHAPYTTAPEGKDPIEYYFQAILYVTFLLLGICVAVETHDGGCADVIVECRSNVWVIRLKCDGTAVEALAQIEKRGYARRFAADAR